MSTTIGVRHKKLRQLLDLTQADLSEKLKTARGYIADIETDRSAPSKKYLAKLSEVLDVNIDWLLDNPGSSATGEFRGDVCAYRDWEQKQQGRKMFPAASGLDPIDPEPPTPLSAEAHAADALARYDARQVRSNGPRDDKATDAERSPSPKDEFALVPFYDVPVSAGAGRSAIDGAATYDIAYRREYIHRRGLVATNLIELPVAGDSMSPELESGDSVLVDRSRTNIGGDGIYVIALDGLLYCKRLQLLPGRTLRVISINKDYETYDVQLPGEDGQDEHIEIIGRVVRQGRDR